MVKSQLAEKVVYGEPQKARYKGESLNAEL